MYFMSGKVDMCTNFSLHENMRRSTKDTVETLVCIVETYYDILSIFKWDQVYSVLLTVYEQFQH